MCLSRARLHGLVFGLSLAVLLASPGKVWALKPTDPVVQAAVDRAVAYLSADGMNVEPIGRGETAYGEHAMVALAILKSGTKGTDKNHFRVKNALTIVKGGIADGSIGHGYPAIYNTAVAIVFLSALDKKAHKADIAKAVGILLKYQKESGAFATTAPVSGDTSMTQYAVLGMWEAHQAGVEVPAAAWERVAKWLMETQLSDGGFVYNPGIGQMPTNSIVSAGMSGLYICATRSAGLGGEDSEAPVEQPGKAEGVPDVFRPVDEGKDDQPKPPSKAKVSIDRGALDAALSRGNDWVNTHWTVSPTAWKFYYLYGIERYNAFRDIYEDRREEEPGWYNEGAAHLIATQDGSGRWSGDGLNRVSTAFGVLFLKRSTRSSLVQIDPVGKGIMVRGSGIPTDLNAIRMQDGAIVAKPLLGPAGDLIDKIADPNDPQFARAVEGFGQLIVKADDTMLSPHLVKLRDIAQSESPEARAAAIKALALASGGKLDDVPTLIYALEDSHWDVRIAARDGLRFISRKFDGFDMDPQGPPEAWAAGVGKWKAWFRSLRPDADFE